MKLHLPKRLLTALLAAFTAITLSTGSAAWANSGLHDNVNYLLGGTGAGSTAQGTYTNLQEATIDAKITTLVTTINAEALTSFNLWADDNRNAWTNALVGSLRVQDKATINISESQWKGSGNVVRYFNELHIANLNIAGEGTAVLNVSLANHNVSIDSVNGTLSSVTNAGNLTLGSIGGSVTLGGNITNTGTLTLRGNVYGTSTITGGTVNLVDFSAAGNLSFGAVQVSGVLGMSSSGNVTWDSLELAEGAILEYGKGANTLNIGTIDKNVTLYLYEVEEKLRSENGVNLGISLGEGQTLETLKSYLSIDGLTSGVSFDLIERDGSVYLTSTGTLDSGWDNHWGAGVLRDRPTSSVQIVDPTGLPNSTNGKETYLMTQNNFTDVKLVSVELTGSGDYSANAVIVGGFATTSNTNSQGSVERDVWIKATAGQYKAIVGGNVADNWNGGDAAHFTGDTHILVNGATVGAIIGGTYRDGQAPKFTGDTYISVLSGDVKDCIFGAAANTHNKTTTFNGNTNIFVYVPLVNTASGDTIGNNGAINAIVGGAGKVANNANDAKSYINGNTNVTIDLSGYTGKATTFAKQIVGGSKNIANSYYAEINGNTYVNIVGKAGITFTKEVIGGSAFGTAGTATINGTTNVQISGGTFSNHIAGGNYSTAGSTNRVTRSSVIINDGSFSVANGQKMVITGGDFTTAASTNTINTSSVTINKGTFSNYSIVGGTYTTAGSTNTVGSSSVTINGGTFSTDSTGGTGDTPYNHLIVGGSMLNGNVANTSFTTTNTSVTITGGDIGMDIYGGHVDLISPSGSHAFTATLDNAIVTLNGANAKVNNIYGGSFAHRDNNNAEMTQGDVVVDLIAGTVRGNVYAAGRQVHNTDIVTKSTEVRISDGVQFTSASAIVSGGYQIGCTTTTPTNHSRNNPSSVTGNKTLVFNGASQDRSAITFDSFDTIQVTNKDAVVTLGTLTNFTDLTKTGAGTLTLSGSSTYTGDTYVEEGMLVVSKSNASSSSYDISEKATLKVEGFTGEWNKTITGDGTLSLVIGNTDNHGNKLTGIGGFTGVLEISKAEGSRGNTNLAAYSLAKGASLRLVSGNNWSDSTSGSILITQDIELAGKTKEDFMFLHENGKTLELSGVVTGTYLTSGESYNGYYNEYNHYNNLTLSGANSRIEHVFMFESSTLTVNADMFFGTVTAATVVIGEGDMLTLGGGTAETPVEHNIAKLSAASGSLSLGDYATLTLGGGTAETPVEHNIAKLSAASGSLSLGNYATLTLGGGTAEAQVTHNIGTLNGGTGSKLHLEANAVMETISTVTGSITVTGSGVYNMGSRVNSNLTGWTDSANWTGTVKINDTKLSIADLSTFGNANSTISVSEIQGELPTQTTEQTIQSHIILEPVSDASCFDLVGTSAANLTFTGKISGSGNMGTAENSAAGHKITFAGDVTDWTGIYWASQASTITYSGNAKVINNEITAGAGKTSTVLYKNTTGMIVKGNINNQKWTNGTLNLQILNENNATGTVVFTGAVVKGTTNLTVEENASAEFTNASVNLNTVDVKEGATLSFATLNAQNVTNSGALNLGTAATITKAEDATAATMTKVQMSSAGISSAATDSTKGSISNALIDLQKATEFSISDMSLSNVSLKAAATGTELNLNNVTAEAVQLAAGQFTLGGEVALSEQTPATKSGGYTASFTTDQLNGITLNNASGAASLTVDLGELPDCLQDGKTYNITIALSGFHMAAYDGTGLLFAADSWLGKLLADQGASQYVSSGDVETATTLAANNNTVTVTYTAMTGGNVGTIITITGLTIPEPTTSTLGLVALAALVTRRRRK